MYYIYTDGSCIPNPGKGGASSILIKDECKIIEKIYNENNTTNNRMELKAVIMSYDIIPDNSECIIYTDSSYVVNGINKWIYSWKKNNWKGVKNRDLWEELDKIQSNKNVKICWIKGHSNNKWNELADKLAKQALKLY
jgi:ribonuclease HI